jgi:hypothetical protein
MSDLAPFVASLLYDRVLTETKEENDSLSEQLQKSRVVQIVSASGTVYAEGQFEDGSYSMNPNLWLVNFTKQLPCPLSDLTNVQICIGGSAKADFGANSFVEGFVERDGVITYKNGWGEIEFCIGKMGWLMIKVGQFPSEEVFRSLSVPEDMASFLTQELAENHPELTVNFEQIDFFVDNVKGTIQNLNLDPAIEEEAQRRRQEMKEEEEEEAQRRRAVAAAEIGVDDGTDVEDNREG